MDHGSDDGRPPEPDDDEHRPSPDELSADAALVDELRRAGFSGPVYELFENHLAAHGLAVVRAWLISGEMFRRCAARGQMVGRRPYDWTEHDISSLANETVTRALVAFREKGLRAGGWRADGGAALTTYFVRGCVYAFPNVYRRWRRDQDRGGAPSSSNLRSPSLPRPTSTTRRRAPCANSTLDTPDETRITEIIQPFGGASRPRVSLCNAPRSERVKAQKCGNALRPVCENMQPGPRGGGPRARRKTMTLLDHLEWIVAQASSGSWGTPLRRRHRPAGPARAQRPDLSVAHLECVRRSSGKLHL
jgi:hypothetical protein